MPMESVTIIPATEKQVTFLRSLVAERMPDVDPSYTDSVIAEGKDRVSKAISRLLDMPVVAKAEPAPRPNMYAGLCDLCEFEVPENEGTVFKADDGKWVVSHLEGGCPQPFGFPAGRYALEDEEGTVHFYVTRRRDIYAQASDELHKLSRKAADFVAEKIEADPETASRRYGIELGQCGICGRTLTSEWRKQGIGPVCVTKVGW